MKAAVLHEAGSAVQIEQVPVPELLPGHALVRLEFASLNHRDVWIRKGQYAGLKFPIVLGSDGSGTVESTADGEGADWVGKPVIVNPSLGWGGSERAQDLASFNILGLPHDGTFAEVVAVPIENLAARPANLSAQQAATIPLAGLTAYRVLFSRGQLKPGEQVLVTGAGGGVAAFAVQMAHAAGAKVWVSSGAEQKIEAAKRLGAVGGVNYRNEDWPRELKSMAGSFDLIVDGAGGAGYRDLTDLAKSGSTIVSYGATAGNVPNFELRRLYWKQLNLLGSTMGSPHDFREMVEFLGQHKIEPVVDCEFALDEANAALDWMEGSHQMGKIVLRVG
jgi:NADPH:quinone reductase-like Zn-dependent oxidoreductase